MQLGLDSEATSSVTMCGEGQPAGTLLVRRPLAYPLLGVAYLLNRLGGVAEAVFFVGFTVMVATQVAERLRPHQRVVQDYTFHKCSFVR